MFQTVISPQVVTAAQLAGCLCQMTTATVAVLTAVLTFCYMRRQNALALVNHNNALANLVNTTLIQSPEARDVMGRVQDVIVGRPDDAVLFLYLNYVHNAYRTHQFGAVSDQVWDDTLQSCACMLARLERRQVEQLLARGYEAAFKTTVLARYDMLACFYNDDTNVTIFPQRAA